MPEPITMIEAVIPRLKDKSEFETTPVWLNYVIDTITESIDAKRGINGKVEGVTLFVNKDVSPVHQIRKIFKNNKPLSLRDIKNVERHVRNIKRVQTSLCQRGTTADKLNFYMCWSLYEQGVSWNKIYDITDKNCSWDSDNKDNVIRKLKRMKTRFQWERK